MYKKLSSQKGFTLVEFLLVLAIFSLVIVATAGFFIMTLQGRAKAQVHIEVQEQARLALERITYEIRRANGVNSASGGTLSLSMSSSSRNPTVFSLTNGTLFMTQGTGSSTPLTSSYASVTSLSFTNLSSGKSKNILIAMTLSKPDPTGNPTLSTIYPLEEAVEIRGK